MAGFLSSIFNRRKDTVRVDPATQLSAPDESVMGFDRNRDLLEAVYNDVKKRSRLSEYSFSRGLIVECDVINLGGVNRHFDEDTGTIILRALGRMMGGYFRYVEEKQDTIYSHHSGGDEFTFITCGRMTEEGMTDLLSSAAGLLHEALTDSNLNQLPHHKYDGAAGVGVLFRIREFDSKAPSYAVLSSQMHAEIADEKKTLSMNNAQTPWSNNSAAGAASIVSYQSETLVNNLRRHMGREADGWKVWQKFDGKIDMPVSHKTKCPGLSEEKRQLDALRQSGMTGTVVRFDLNGLGTINKEQGREKADAALSLFEKIIAKETKGTGGTLYHSSGGTYDLVVTDMDADALSQLRRRVYARVVSELRSLAGDSAGVMITHADIAASNTFDRLADMAFVQKKYGVAFAEGDGAGYTVYPVASDRASYRVTGGNAGAHVPFAAALRRNLTADDLESLLLSKPDKIALALNGGTVDDIVTQGQAVAMLEDILRHDVPNVFRNLYIAMGARDPLPPDCDAMANLSRAVVLLKQAAHVYGDPSLFDAQTAAAAWTLWSDAADTFETLLSDKGEAHLLDCFRDMRSRRQPSGNDTPQMDAQTACGVIAGALKKVSAAVLEQGLAAKGILGDGRDEELPGDVARAAENIGTLSARINASAQITAQPRRNNGLSF